MHDFSETLEIKKRLRREILARRERLLPSVRQKYSRKISEHVLDLPGLKEGMAVAFYWPIRDEVDCRSSLAGLANRGVIIVLPAIIGAQKPLVFRQFRSEENLVEAGFGTKEPADSMPVIEPAIIFLPLAGFDKEGNRLGYGKGFYDRTIAAMTKRNLKRPKLVGLAFAMQELEHIPASPFDQKLDGVITEHGRSWFECPA